jgi:hypothetical protein
VRHVAYYDDLDAECLKGGISLAGSAFDELWSICRLGGLRVLADVHTHPAGWVMQSAVDMANPMMALPGHVALVVGHFASGPVNPDSVGVHLYEGHHEWQHLPNGAGIRRTWFDRPSHGVNPFSLARTHRLRGLSRGSDGAAVGRER